MTADTDRPFDRDPVAEWRSRGDHVRLDAGEVFVVDQPASDPRHEPVLVLHGFPTCSFDWRHVLPALSAQRRVVLVDFLGFGLSEKPDRRYSIRLHADVVQAVVSGLGIDEVALVTHDMGDTVGGELLARDLEGDLPFAVSRRVLSNGSIYIGMAQLTPGQEMLLSLDDARLDLPPGTDMSEGFGSGVASTFAPGRQPDAEELAAQWELVSHLDGYTLLPRTIRYIEDRRAEEARFTGAIEQHPSPLGVVWGALDPVAVHAMTDRLLEARPATARTTLDDVGHYPMIEDPDRFTAAVLAHLDG